MLAKLLNSTRKLQQYFHSYNVYITLLVSLVVEPENLNLEPLLVQYQSAYNDNLQIRLPEIRTPSRISTSATQLARTPLRIGTSAQIRTPIRTLIRTSV